MKAGERRTAVLFRAVGMLGARMGGLRGALRRAPAVARIARPALVARPLASLSSSSSLLCGPAPEREQEKRGPVYVPAAGLHSTAVVEAGYVNPKFPNRPTSPHVMIYAFPTVAISSITMRICGVLLSIGTLPPEATPARALAQAPARCLALRAAGRPVKLPSPPLTMRANILQAPGASGRWRAWIRACRWT